MNSPSLHLPECWTRPTNSGRIRGAGPTTTPRFVYLLHGDPKWLAAPVLAEPALGSLSGISSEAEESELEALND